jgi:hypothetical protein
LLVAVAGVLLAACSYDPKIPLCLIPCSTAADCPSGGTCNAGLCTSPGGTCEPKNVYVSSSRGTASGDGTASTPVNSIALGLTLAKSKSATLHVCAEEYHEAFVLVNGVSANGHWDCTKGEGATTLARAVIRAPTSPAATASGLTLPARIEGFEILAPDLDAGPAEIPALSSIGLYVAQTKGLTFVDVEVQGGKAGPGRDGVSMANVESGTKGGDAKPQGMTTCTTGTVIEPGLLQLGIKLPGCKETTTILGSKGGTSICAQGTAGGPGGNGGDGAFFNPGATVNPARNPHGRPLVATDVTAVGGVEGLAGFRGQDGSDGNIGKNGNWSITANGFTPGDGVAGEDGQPGMGGGGGGGNASYRCSGGPCSPAGTMYFFSAAGAGGGSGGCPGLAGTPGRGGGASIAALIVASEIRFEKARLVASAGGRAGRGALGSDGLAGGLPGAAVPFAGAGGGGGKGGGSGLSGHGDPGPSIALAYSFQPEMIQVTLVPGPAGEGQPALSKMLQSLPAVVGQSLRDYTF